MASSEQQARRGMARSSLAWLASLAIAIGYMAIPEDHSRDPVLESEPEELESDPWRIEVVDVSPHDPYPGSTLAIRHSRSQHELFPFVGKRPLRVLFRRPGELIAELPRDVLPGDLKVRVATDEAGAFSSRVARSKPYHLRVRAPDYRKVFRGLVGGTAMVLFGILLLARGVRESIGLSAARFFTRVARRHELMLCLGGLLGALAQTTTGAAGVLSGLASARVLGVVPAAYAFLAAPLGAALAPFVVFGLVEPREGLVAVAIGVVWFALAANRRARAYARLLLGTGFVAFGLQTFRPGLEPFLADAFLWSVLEHLRTPSALDLALCGLLGSLAVAALHSPAPLIVLLLGISQATGHFNLEAVLALLAGSAFGASLAALITAPAGPRSRALARLHLVLGAAASVLAVASVELWVWLSDSLLGPLQAPSHWTTRVPLAELGLRVLIGFGASQLGVIGLLLPFVPALSRWLDRTQTQPVFAQDPEASSTREQLSAALSAVLEIQQQALGDMVALSLSGARRHGHAAEQRLSSGRTRLEELLAGPVRQVPASAETAGLAGAAFAALQLQNALEFLLRTSERMIDARIGIAEGGSESANLPWDDETLLRSLHRLVSEGLDAARASLQHQEPVDIDSARAREIQINRLEADARGVMLNVDRRHGLNEGQMYVLEVVSAYEVSGNQIYRLSEILGQGASLPSLISA